MNLIPAKCLINLLQHFSVIPEALAINLTAACTFYIIFIFYVPACSINRMLWLQCREWWGADIPRDTHQHYLITLDNLQKEELWSG